MSRIKVDDLPVNEELDTEDTKTTIGGEKIHVESWSWGVTNSGTFDNSSTRDDSEESSASIDVDGLFGPNTMDPIKK